MTEQRDERVKKVGKIKRNLKKKIREEEKRYLEEDAEDAMDSTRFDCEVLDMFDELRDDLKDNCAGIRVKWD